MPRTFTHDLFICYSRRDSRFVDRLCSALLAHHIRLWRDTSSLRVGDQHVSSIGAAIDASRFFAIVISPAALKSDFVKKIELESALNRMIADRRESFVLPLMWKKPERIPSPLNTFNYLDFTKPRNFMTSANLLAARVLLEDEKFTGVRLYKEMDVTQTGTLVGVGEPLRSEPVQSGAVRLFFEDGKVKFVELLARGEREALKSVHHDSMGRVEEITLYKDGTVVDTWRYVYDERTGLRTAKLVVRPGERPHRRIEYDDKGDKVSDRALSEPS